MPDGRQLLVIYQSGDQTWWIGPRMIGSFAPFEAVGRNDGPCAFSPSGQILAVSRSHARACAFTGHVHSPSKWHPRPVQSCKISCATWRGRRIAGCWRSPRQRADIELWHVETRRLLYNLRPAILGTKILHVRFSGDGQTLAARSGSTRRAGKFRRRALSLGQLSRRYAVRLHGAMRDTSLRESMRSHRCFR